MLSNKLKDYFKNNIKLCLKSRDKIFIISKSDVIYEIAIIESLFPRMQKKCKPQLSRCILLKRLFNGNKIFKRFRHFAARNSEMTRM
jgi:hypothetical protein